MNYRLPWNDGDRRFTFSTWMQRIFGAFWCADLVNHEMVEVVA